MKRSAAIGICLLIVSANLFADELTPDRGWMREHASGVTIELWSDADTWQPDPELPEYGHSYRKLRVYASDGALLLEKVLPIDRSRDFGYRLSFDAGDAPWVVVVGAFRFYLVDLADPSAPKLVGPVRPLSQDEIIGVDAQSGQIVGLWMSDDGTRIGGGVVNGGCFVMDISTRSRPERISYVEDWTIQGEVPTLPCQPEDN